MSYARLIGWVVLCVWIVWLHAFQGLLSSDPALGAWVPDLALLLVIGLASHLSERNFLALALVAALARIALSAHPAAAVLVGYLVIVRLAFGLRSVLDVSGVGMRALLGGVCVFGMNAWLAMVDRVRLDARVGTGFLELSDLLPGALASAAAAFFIGPLLVHLPGLTPLRKPRW